jgi:hypothetical protein
MLSAGNFSFWLSNSLTCEFESREWELIFHGKLSQNLDLFQSKLKTKRFQTSFEILSVTAVYLWFKMKFDL